jgi:hypothetical protein
MSNYSIPFSEIGHLREVINSRVSSAKMQVCRTGGRVRQEEHLAGNLIWLESIFCFGTKHVIAASLIEVLTYLLSLSCVDSLSDLVTQDRYNLAMRRQFCFMKTGSLL